jgi:hypothetical protein
MYKKEIIVGWKEYTLIKKDGHFDNSKWRTNFCTLNIKQWKKSAWFLKFNLEWENALFSWMRIMPDFKKQWLATEVFKSYLDICKSLWLNLSLTETQKKPLVNYILSKFGYKEVSLDIQTKIDLIRRKSWQVGIYFHDENFWNSFENSVYFLNENTYFRITDLTEEVREEIFFTTHLKSRFKKS